MDAAGGGVVWGGALRLRDLGCSCFERDASTIRKDSDEFEFGAHGFDVASDGGDRWAVGAFDFRHGWLRDEESMGDLDLGEILTASELRKCQTEIFWPPDRAWCPLCPLPAVPPVPVARPLPRRFFTCVAPFAGRMSASFI